MNRDPDAIRNDIEATRLDLREDVDAIADRVSPSGMARRQNRRTKEALHRVRESVMGPVELSDSKTGGPADGPADGPGDALHDAPERIAERTRGNPLAAGMIAFGAGMLLGGIFPGSEKEREMVHTLKERAEPVTAELGDAARQVAEDLKEPVREAVENVKASAQASAESLKEEASGEAGQPMEGRGDSTEESTASRPTGTATGYPVTGSRNPGERP